MPDEREGAVAEFIEAAERTLSAQDAPAAFDETMLRQPLSTLELHAPIVVDADASVLEAVTVMREARVGCVLVVKAGKLAGIFTERDVLTRIAGRDIDAAATPLRDVMTADPEYLRPSDSIAYALNAMSLGGYRHVPLVDDSRVPVGVVSVRDVIQYLVRRFPKSVMNLPTLPRQNYVREREGA
jgi:CBS domain-containing protein